jgi:hypothetical protein
MAARIYRFGRESQAEPAAARTGTPPPFSHGLDLLAGEIADKLGGVNFSRTFPESLP